MTTSNGHGSTTACDNGDWPDHVTYRAPSSPRDEERMLDFVNQHFVPNEPLNVAIDMCQPGYR